MSCFPESTYSFFVDGELAMDEARLVQTHLVGCPACRSLVVELREETTLLADVLHERERQSFRLAPRTAPPPRELAAGLVPLVGLGVVALAVLGWLVESLPRGVEWLNPFRAEGGYEMGFDLLFMIRDQAPGLFSFLVSLAGMASFSMLILFFVSALSRRFSGTIAFVALILASVAAPSPSAALELRFHEDEVAVPKGETLDQTLIVNADTVRVDGIVDGDLVVLLAERLILRGEVRGNVFSSARTFEISGKVAGNLHAVGEKVRLDGQVGGNMYSASEVLTIAPGARVGRDSTHAAAGTTLEGEVGRDFFVLGDWLDVRGTVKRDVATRAGRVSLLDGARIGGDVDATFRKPREVEVDPGAVVAGEVRSHRDEHGAGPWHRRYAEPHFYAWIAIRLGAAFALGMLLYALTPSLFSVHLTSAGGLVRSLGIGFVASIATPIALVLVGITLIGIPIAVLGLAVFVSGLYVSGILIAALVGSQVTRPRTEAWGHFAIALLTGLVILIVATELPFVGVPVRVVVVLTGLGLLVERVQSGWRATRPAAVV